jgi:hypothetical protein
MVGGFTRGAEGREAKAAFFPRFDAVFFKAFN